MFKLNIYKEHSRKEIEKTYETEEIHVMYGTLEDIAAVVNCDITEKNNAITIGKTVVQAMPVINDLLLTMFDGLTREELRRTRLEEVISLIIDVTLYTADWRSPCQVGARSSVRLLRDTSVALARRRNRYPIFRGLTTCRPVCSLPTTIRLHT